MPEYGFLQVDAAAVVSVGSTGSHAPQRLGHERLDVRTVVFALVIGGSQVVALEVGVNVLYEERPAFWHQLRQRLPVMFDVEERRSSGVETIEDAVPGVMAGFHICDPPVALNPEIRRVTVRTADLLQKFFPLLSPVRLLAERRLEVVEQVELQVVDHRGVDFIDYAVLVAVDRG